MVRAGEADLPTIRLALPDVGDAEIEAVRDVLLSGILTNGPRTAEFERRFAELHHVEHAVAVANGTVALTAIYLGLGIGPGDEVIIPSMTFVSSVTSVLHVGATPVFADIDGETFTLDPRDVAERISTRTRAILAVHYGGQPADMVELRALASEAGCWLLEDAAEAHGARYRGVPVGGLGDAAMFSFTPTKNITTGEGGVITTHDQALAERIRLLRNHGQVAPYEHAMVGYNWRMSELQAAMGVEQLRKLGGILARKRANAQWLGMRLGSVAGIETPVESADREHTFMMYSILVAKRRDEVRDRLLADGIEVRVYFPPVHRQPIFREQRLRLPITEHVAARLLSLPFHSRLTRDELDRIAKSVEDAVVAIESDAAADL